MPALAAAKEQSRRTKCLAMLREVYVAAKMHENEHNGCFPIAGWHWHLPNGVCNPEGLGDKDQKRYMYYDEGGEKRPLPITAALGHYMGVDVRTDSRANLEADLQMESLTRLFRCPSVEAVPPGWSQRGGDQPWWTAPDEFSTYVFNEAVLGRRDRYDDPGLMGRAFKAKRPAEVFFAMDGRPRDGAGDRWLMVPDMAPQYTLLDFDRDVRAPTNTLGEELLDFWRHDMRANVVFLDGHAETRGMGPESLKEIGVSKGLTQ